MISPTGADSLTVETWLGGRKPFKHAAGIKCTSCNSRTQGKARKQANASNGGRFPTYATGAGYALVVPVGAPRADFLTVRGMEAA